MIHLEMLLVVGRRLQIGGQRFCIPVGTIWSSLLTAHWIFIIGFTDILYSLEESHLTARGKVHQDHRRIRRGST